MHVKLVMFFVVLVLASAAMGGVPKNERRMMWMLVAIAIGERRTLLNMAIPFSVKA